MLHDGLMIDRHRVKEKDEEQALLFCLDLQKPQPVALSLFFDEQNKQWILCFLDYMDMIGHIALCDPCPLLVSSMLVSLQT